MLDGDRHLNIFEHYANASTQPIENNLSRGFAGILRSYPLVLDRFIDYINVKCADKIPRIIVAKPESLNDFAVGFQRSIRQIAESAFEPLSVIGITLTAAMGAEGGDGGFKPGGPSEAGPGLVTDIVVFAGDAAIIAEVKRTGASAAAQCEQQVKSLIREISPDNYNSQAISHVMLSGTWGEIVEILQKAAELLRENCYGVLPQYIQHLELRCPEWFPARRLSDIDLSEKNDPRILKRIAAIANGSCGNSDAAEFIWNAWTIPVHKPYAGGALIDVNYETKSLDITIYLADLKRQGGSYFRRAKGDMSWIFDDKLTVGGESFVMAARPYIRFGFVTSTVFILYLNEGFCKEKLGSEMSNWLGLWLELSWKWLRKDWPELEKMLTETFAGAVSCEEYANKMAESFVNTKRQYVNVSLAVQVSVKITKSVIDEREPSDGLSPLVKEIVQEMLRKIES
jgi:hypothetical protein